MIGNFVNRIFVVVDVVMFSIVFFFGLVIQYVLVYLISSKWIQEYDYKEIFYYVIVYFIFFFYVSLDGCCYIKK